MMMMMAVMEEALHLLATLRGDLSACQPAGVALAQFSNYC